MRIQFVLIPVITLVTTPLPLDFFGCEHPGYLENGFVIPDRMNGDRYPPGEKVEYVCTDGYVIDGGNDKIYCQSDFTWSQERPIICLPDEGEISFKKPKLKHVAVYDDTCPLIKHW